MEDIPHHIVRAQKQKGPDGVPASFAGVYYYA